MKKKRNTNGGMMAFVQSEKSCFSGDGVVTKVDACIHTAYIE